MLCAVQHDACACSTTDARQRPESVPPGPLLQSGQWPPQPPRATRRSSASRCTPSCAPSRRCSAAARHRLRQGEPDEPNTRVCPVCLGMPGTLPVINRRAVELVIRTGIALDCHIETEAVRFERKNYFYPDLPKGYQISQYALPLCSNGRLSVPVPAEEAEVSIGITRAHLEEDTARLQHGGRGYSLVDFNRAGRAADGDRHRARCPLAGPGAGVRRDAARHPAAHRRLGRRHGDRVDADRGQHQPADRWDRPASAPRSRSRT